MYLFSIIVTALLEQSTYDGTYKILVALAHAVDLLLFWWVQ